MRLIHDSLRAGGLLVFTAQTGHVDIRMVNTVFTGFDGRSLTAFQHTYTIHTGQAPITVHHAIFVTDAPDWPHVTMVRRNILGRLLYRLGMKRGLLLEDETFNGSLKIKTDDEDFALTLIHPEMQKFLASMRTASWAAGAGRLAMVRGGAIKPDRFEQDLECLRLFWEFGPEELLA